MFRPEAGTDPLGHPAQSVAAPLVLTARSCGQIESRPARQRTPGTERVGAWPLLVGGPRRPRPRPDRYAPGTAPLVSVFCSAGLNRSFKSLRGVMCLKGSRTVKSPAATGLGESVDGGEDSPSPIRPSVDKFGCPEPCLCSPPAVVTRDCGAVRWSKPDAHRSATASREEARQPGTAVGRKPGSPDRRKSAIAVRCRHRNRRSDAVRWCL